MLEETTRFWIDPKACWQNQTWERAFAYFARGRFAPFRFTAYLSVDELAAFPILGCVTNDFHNLANRQTQWYTISVVKQSRYLLRRSSSVG